jgi:hypothetical protein
VWATIGGVSANTWHHIALTMVNSTKILSVYRNASNSGTTIGSAVVNPTNPNYLIFGKTFFGNIREIRYWREANSNIKIAKYFNRYLEVYTTEPSLHRAWRAVNPADDTVIKNYANTRSNGTVEFTSIWVTYPESEFLCALDTYISGGCQPCLTMCDRCTDSGIFFC